MKIPPTGPSFSASLIRLFAPSGVVQSVFETRTFTPFCSHLLMHKNWNPFVTPDRETRTILVAPRLINQLASSKPNPPRPPLCK